MTWKFTVPPKEWHLAIRKVGSRPRFGTSWSTSNAGNLDVIAEWPSLSVKVAAAKIYWLLRCNVVQLERLFFTFPMVYLGFISMPGALYYIEMRNII